MFICIMEAVNIFLCTFFFEILKTCFLNDDSEEATNEISHENKKKCEKENTGNEDKLNIVRGLLSQPLTMQNVACFYECNVCLASSTARSFFELTKKNSDFFQKKMTYKTINICCIAGGIASEVVAVIKVLCMEMKNSKMDYLNFQVTFISKDKKWRKKIEIVMKKLQEKMTEVKEIKISSRFVLSRAVTEDSEVFCDTDILISTKFSQEIIGIKKKEFKELLEIAFRQMRRDSLFYFINTFGDGMISAVKETVSKFKFLNLVNEENSGRHSDTIKNHMNEHSDYFGVDLDCGYCSYYACVWKKLYNRRKSITEGASTSIDDSENRKKNKKHSNKK